MSVGQSKSYDPYNPALSRWDREAIVYTPPKDSTLRAAYRARELAEEGERVLRAEKQPWYTNIGGFELSKRPQGSAMVQSVREGPGGQQAQEEAGSDRDFWYLPQTTRAAALRARELEIEARRADKARQKSGRFTWIGGLPSWAKRDATVPDYAQKARGVGLEAPM